MESDTSPLSPIIPAGSPLEFNENDMSTFETINYVVEKYSQDNTNELLPSDLYSPKIDINRNSESTIRSKKKYVCKYCFKEYAKLPRHIEMIHGDKEEIKNILKLPVGSQRKNAWDQIRNMGIYMKNLQVSRKGFGVLQSKRKSPGMKLILMKLITYLAPVARHFYEEPIYIDIKKNVLPLFQIILHLKEE